MSKSIKSPFVYYQFAAGGNQLCLQPGCISRLTPVQSQNGEHEPPLKIVSVDPDRFTQKQMSAMKSSSTGE